MAGEQKDELGMTQETIAQTEQKAEEEMALEIEHAEEKTETKSSGGSIFTGIYDQLPDISVKSVDRFILICVIAFVAVILIGVLKANHVF